MHLKFTNNMDKVLDMVSHHAGTDGTRVKSVLHLVAGHPSTRFAHIYHLIQEKWLRSTIGNRFELVVPGFSVFFSLEFDDDRTVIVDKITFSDGRPISIADLMSRYPQKSRTSH